MDSGTDMPPVLLTSTSCQAGCHFDNEVIPPGAPCPKLPWAYSYAQFDALLTAYPDVHPEDFVTFGILQAQPRRGSYTEWGEVASVLAHMVGGKRTLANELSIIIQRIQRLPRADPIRATEEEALVAVVMRERRRSGVPLGDEAYATLTAPGGPLAHAAPPWDPRRRPPTHPSTSDPQPGPSGTQGGCQRPGPTPGPSGAQAGPPYTPPGFETVDLTADADEEEDMDESSQLASC